MASTGNGTTSDPSVALHVLVPRSLKEWLERIAADDNVSEAATLRRILSRAKRELELER